MFILSGSVGETQFSSSNTDKTFKQKFSSRSCSPASLIKIKLGEFTIVENGQQVQDYNKEDLKQYMQWNYIEVSIELNIGNNNFIAYTCDFTKDYIDINADYRN